MAVYNPEAGAKSVFARPSVSLFETSTAEHRVLRTQRKIFFHFLPRRVDFIKPIFLFGEVLLVMPLAT